VDYLGTVRGRAGYLVMPPLLAYLTGGLAYGGAYLYYDLGSVTYALPAIVQTTDREFRSSGRAPHHTSPSPATLRERV
jgi:outer membrane immunogenic protein